MSAIAEMVRKPERTTILESPQLLRIHPLLRQETLIRDEKVMIMRAIGNGRSFNARIVVFEFRIFEFIIPFPS